jgi:hypothetical protein
MLTDKRPEAAQKSDDMPTLVTAVPGCLFSRDRPPSPFIFPSARRASLLRLLCHSPPSRAQYSTNQRIFGGQRGSSLLPRCGSGGGAPGSWRDGCRSGHMSWGGAPLRLGGEPRRRTSPAQIRWPTHLLTPRTVWIRRRSARIGPRQPRIEPVAPVNVERAEELAIDRHRDVIVCRSCFNCCEHVAFTFSTCCECSM